MRPGQYDSRLGGKWARGREVTFTNQHEEAYKQGQRDREQGWPDLSDRWGFSTTGVVDAYRRGYNAPRTPR